MGVQELEICDKLKKIAKQIKSKHPRGYEPKIDEDVLIFMIMEGKWLRGKVDAITNHCDSKNYVIWCMDIG